MKLRFLHFLSAAAALLCASCTADSGLDGALAKPQPLVFTATQDVLTADTRAAADGTWKGDGTEYVAIQIGDDVKKYKVTSTDGTLAPNSDSDTFYRTDTKDLAVTAWYPYSDTQPTGPDIQADQSTAANREASNLMTASATATYGSATTTLAFTHSASRINIRVVDGDGNSVTGAKVECLLTNPALTLTAYEDGSGNYSFLVSPNASVAEDAEFISITVDGATYKATAPATATFEGGQSYSYQFTLKSDATTINAPYLTFSAKSEQTFTMAKSGTPNVGTFQYSVGEGDTWTTYTLGDPITFGGDKGGLRLRGESSIGTATNISNYCQISFGNTGVAVEASGDIRTLVDYADYENVSTSSAKFCYLFYECSVLTKAPELPATTLASFCYYGMFWNCEKLTKAPALPATELAYSCYASMFQSCENLTSAPALPATELANSCYQDMFGYTGLTEAPELPATQLADYCYQNMFSGCRSLEKVTIKATGTATDALENWLSGVVRGGTIYKYSALTLEENSASGIPSGWSAETLSE